MVEDDQNDAELVAHELERAGHRLQCERVDNAAALETALARQPWDIIISDYRLPQFTGLEALKTLQGHDLDLPFILVSGTIGEAVAVAAMKAGAHDYIMKDNLSRLVPAVERELREADGRRERRRAETAWRDEAQISAAVGRVATELIALLDLPRILDRACQMTAEVLQCDSSHAFLWRPDERVYTPVSSYGDTPEQWESLRVLRLPRALAADIVDRLERDEVVQTAITPAGSAAAAVLARSGITVALFVGLRRGTEMIGILTAGYRGSKPAFSPQQERIAHGVGQLASMALENGRLVDELERANRIKADFLATMSHELRTPLNVIIGYQDLLEDGAFGTLTAEQIEPLRRAHKSADELLQLISATLDLSRLEAGRLPIESAAVAVQEVIDEVLVETRLTYVKPNLQLCANVATQLPHVHTDPLKLKVVLKNLVGNAIKFTEQGSVTVSAALHGEGVEIAVTDTGTGIKPEALPIIFEPFRQAESVNTRRYEGAGLGLYIVRRLLDVLGGTIAVESEVGRGSTFRVWLPTAGPRPPQPPPVGTEKP